MQNIVKQIHTRLLKAGQTVAIAESCTGGIVSSLLTNLPGSSSFFKLGVVAYSNEAKHKVLNIPRSKIKQHGAVSCQVAKMMANSVRLLAKTDIGIGITGIAGPGGATAKKPAGTVYIAVSSRTRTLCRKFRFKGRRAKIRNQASRAALIMGTSSKVPPLPRKHRLTKQGWHLGGRPR